MRGSTFPTGLHVVLSLGGRDEENIWQPCSFAIGNNGFDIHYGKKIGRIYLDLLGRSIIII